MAGNDLIGSLVKGMEIIKLVGQKRHGLQVSEIANLLDMKVSSAHNMVRTLLVGGFLERQPDRRIVIGNELIEILRRAPHSELLEGAEIEMFRLHHEFPDMVLNFVIPRQGEICRRLRMSYHRPNYLQKAFDTILPYSTAAGLLFLTFGDESLRAELTDHYPFSEFGIQYWTNQEQLDAAIVKCRRDGYAMLPPNMRQTKFSISVPIFNRQKTIVAAIGVHTPYPPPSITAEEKRILNALRHTAGRLEINFTRS